ncbi:MAG: 23S rRNA (uracil(747)-C(5))-methyltransferase RlmC [Sulfuricurvum sp.]
MSFCPFYNAHTCRSCGWIQTPYPQQLSQKGEMLRTLLDPFSPQSYVPSVESPSLGFRNKAKMVASATSSGITLGLSDGVSLTHCPLYDTAMHTALHSIQAWLNHLGIKAYDVEKKKGELKYVLLTQSRYDGSMMVRLVLRSHGVLKRIQKALEELLSQEPHIMVVTANIQPLHAAILEGEEELFLTPCRRLEEQFNGIPLFIRPKSFFQTNPTVAEKLYQTASEWVDESNPTILWDLFCGVGGFALHCATPNRTLVGIEIQAEAIECARDSARSLGYDHLRFESMDTAQFHAHAGEKPQVVIVNPPRRGLGESLCHWLQTQKSQRIIYSSCNAVSLAKDLRYLSDYRVERVQLFDMFPHTEHYETLVELVKII